MTQSSPPSSPSRPPGFRRMVWRIILSVIVLLLGVYVMYQRQSPPVATGPNAPEVVAPGESDESDMVDGVEGEADAPMSDSGASPTAPDGSNGTAVNPANPSNPLNPARRRTRVRRPTTRTASPSTSPSSTQPTWGDATIISPGTPGAAPVAAAEAIMSASFTPDGRLLVGRTGGRIEIVDLITSQRQAIGTRLANPSSIAMSPGGEQVAVAAPAGSAVWHIVSASERKLAAANATSIAFSIDGRTLANGLTAGDLQLWDAIGWNQTAAIPGGVGSIEHIAFSPDGRTIALAGTGVTVWDGPNRQQRTKLGAEHCPGVAFSTDGHMIATAGANGATIWETTFWQKLATLGGQPVTHLAYWPARSLLVTAGADRIIRLWDLGTKQAVTTLPAAEADIVAMALSPDGRNIAVCSAAGIMLWDSTTRTSRRIDAK